jgi:tetratricopeptide (TPR) repeat protein
MKRLLLIFSVLVPIFCFGQSEIERLVQVGIQYHDKGEYAEAIEVYKKALKIDPKSTLVNYELSLTYMYAGDNENVIKHSDVVIKQKKDHLLPAYITKGSALDNLGKTTQSIKLFKEAIAEFGNNYLLYYNLGINYSKIHDNKNAELAFIEAITSKPNHASSHYVLALLE